VKSVKDIFEPLLYRSLHAMHDTGCYTEKLVDELVTMIFAHYDKADLALYFSVESHNDKFVKLSHNLPDNKKETLRHIIDKHVQILRNLNAAAAASEEGESIVDFNTNALL